MYNRGSEISSEDQNNPAGHPGNDDESGNSERDWEIFNVLCSDVSRLKLIRSLIAELMRCFAKFCAQPRLFFL